MAQPIRIINEIKFLILTLFVLVPVSLGYTVYYIQHEYYIKATITSIHVVVGVVVLPFLIKKKGNVVMARFVFGVILSTGLLSMILSNFSSGTEASWFITIPLFYFAVSGFKQGVKWNIFSYIVLLFYYLTVRVYNITPLDQIDLDINTVLANVTVFVTSGYFAYRVEGTHTALEKQANHDNLTGIYNRGWVRDATHNLINSKREKDKDPFSLILIDLDHFKVVNDQYGHLVGDKLLVKFTELINKNIRNEDMFARWGGEEFIVVLKSTTLKEAKIITEQLRKITEKARFSFSEATIGITASFGVTEYISGQSFENLLNAADKALYYSKQNGRNMVHCYCDSKEIA